MRHKLEMLFDWKWKLAKFGFWLVRLWIEDQYEIDGDWVQVTEIIDEALLARTKE